MNDLITVTLRLLDGDREGPITAQIEGSESRAVSFARTDWYKAIGHEVLGDLLAQPGVYVLVGRSSDLVRPRVYIGQADRLSSRLNSHLSSPAKSWWERACVFTGGMNPTSIDWLEAELIADARRAGRSVVRS